MIFWNDKFRLSTFAHTASLPTRRPGFPAPGGPGGLSDHRQLQRDHRQRIPVHLKTKNARPLWKNHSGRASFITHLKKDTRKKHAKGIQTVKNKRIKKGCRRDYWRCKNCSYELFSFPAVLQTPCGGLSVWLCRAFRNLRHAS